MTERPRSLARLHVFALTTAVALGALILMGGFVTASHSGLGCGTEWPLCRGQLTPPLGHFHAWMEGLHRLLALIASLGVLGLFLSSLPSRLAGWPGSETLRRIAYAAAGLILLEVVLGMVTVLFDLPAWVIGLHMADAGLILGLVLSYTRLTGALATDTTIRDLNALKKVRAVSAMSSTSSLPVRDLTGLGGLVSTRRLYVLAAILAVLSAALGSYVTHSHSAASCVTGRFACVGDVGTPLGAGLPIVAVHVLAALMLGVILLLAIRQAPKAHSGLLFGLATGAYLVQILLGLALLWTGLDPAVLWLHEGVGALVMGLWVTLAIAPDLPVALAPSQYEAESAATL